MWGFLAAAVGPLAIRALVAVGFGVVTFAGVQTAFAALTGYAQQYWSALPSSVLALASMCGVDVALGLVFGAMVGRLAVWGVINGSKLVFGATS
jgi:hypothetical protein